MHWKISNELVDYEHAVDQMEQDVQKIASGQLEEQIWLLEHPPLYTCGPRGKDSDILIKDHLPIYQSGRGGQVTYHGPGQRVGYVMLDLKQREPDIRAYVYRLEEWLIQTLARFDIQAFRRAGRVGLWVPRADGRDDKIAAIGVRIKKWITFHGFSLNVCPDLTHYAGIIPCGIQEHGVTSMERLGVRINLEQIDRTLKQTFEQVF